jgi:hypothetical protein
MKIAIITEPLYYENYQSCLLFFDPPIDGSEEFICLIHGFRAWLYRADQFNFYTNSFKSGALAVNRYYCDENPSNDLMLKLAIITMTGHELIQSSAEIIY